MRLDRIAPAKTDFLWDKSLPVSVDRSVARVVYRHVLGSAASEGVGNAVCQLVVVSKL